MVIDLLAEAMAKESTGFLVDGFPATIEQVELTYSWSETFEPSCKFFSSGAFRIKHDLSTVYLNFYSGATV